jgi:O-antigen polysaccharide polymerase Wzy
MAVIGIAILLKPESFAVFGNVIHALQSAPMAALIIFGLLGRRYFRMKPDVFTLIFVAGTAFLFFVSVRSSSKAFLMFSFLPLLWMLLARRDLRRWLPAAIVPLALLYLLIIAPTVNRARGESLAIGEMRSEHLQAAFSNIDFSTFSPTDTENIGKQLEFFLGRQFDPMAAAYLVGRVERDGYQMGATMQYATYAFIPRVLWPEKPNVSRGDWFNKYVGAAPGTSLGISAVGELYWNFGVPGVAIGMFVLGCGYGILWRMAGTDPLARPLHMLLYVIITITGMTDMPQAVTVLAAQLSYGLIFGMVFALFERQSRVNSAKTGVKTA